jgi:hypothetical protein
MAIALSARRAEGIACHAAQDTGTGMIDITSPGATENTMTGIMNQGAIENTMTGIINPGDTHASTINARTFVVAVMTKCWLIALSIAGLSSGQAFADCVPSPDTPASVIEYFQKFNKPLPEQFCAKEDAAPQASEEPSQERPQAYEDSPEQPPPEQRGHHAHFPPDYLPIPEPPYPPPYGIWPRHLESSRSGFEWFY